MSQSFQGSNGRIGSNGIASSFGHSQPIRVNSTTSINSDDDSPHNAVSRELRTAAGNGSTSESEFAEKERKLGQIGVP